MDNSGETMARRKAKRLTLTERMRQIRKTDTGPELIVRRMLHGMGYRYRLHGAQLPGTPDIVLTRHRKVIFVHGCFWHRHDCSDGVKLPRSKPEYWGPKFERNRLRDEANIKRLQEMGWKVLIIWECEARQADHVSLALSRFLRPHSRSDKPVQSCANV
jgi:DNA mismatch endonuclease, patch repair protein